MFIHSNQFNSFTPSFEGSKVNLSAKEISTLLENNSVEEIAKLHNISKSAVRERMKIFGIKTQRMLNKETNDVFIKNTKLIDKEALSKIAASTDLPKSTILEIANEHYKSGKPKNGSVAAIFNQRKRAEVLAQNISNKEAAEILNTSEKRVAKLRQIMGISKPNRKFSRQEKCNLIQSELKNGLTEKEISEKYNMPRYAVKSLIKQINETL